MDDLREFIKTQNMYPTEKNLKLLFERLDKNESGTIDLDEF